MAENERKPTKQEALLGQLAPHIAAAGHGSLTADGPFRCIVRAALVKSFEFAVHAQEEHAEPFFITSTLRGVCEDVIVLSFLAGLSDRDEIVIAMNAINLAESLNRQTAFFKDRPWQPIVREKPGHYDSCLAQMRTIAERHGWDRKRFPTVQYMADACQLRPVYDFMYSATSQWVHCSPHILLRMGWGGQGEVPNCDTRWTFSTKQFRQYYNDFNRIYSVFLLLLLCKAFESEVEQADEVRELCASLTTALNKELRWPELVTHEELNLPAPGYLYRLLKLDEHEESSGPS